MLRPSQEEIDKRWDALSEELREALYSPLYGETIFQIGADNHLDERKSAVVAGLAGYVIFGFLHPDELDSKIAKEIGLNPEAASSIAEEVDRKIFSQFKEALGEVYSPVLMEDVEEVGEPTKEVSAEAAKEEAGKPVEQEKVRAAAMPRKGEPLVIHKEEVPLTVAKREVARKGFSFSPRGFFEARRAATTPRAEVKKPEKRTVHYSEYRTPVPGLGGESFIDLTKLSPSSQGRVPYKDIEPKPAQGKKEKPEEPQPKIEGNIVDLR